MKKATVEIINKAGLHARASSKLVEVASRFSSDVRIGHEKMVDGKSILALMMLAASKGTQLSVETSGDDETQALDAIVALIHNKFDESE